MSNWKDLIEDSPNPSWAGVIIGRDHSREWRTQMRVETSSIGDQRVYLQLRDGAEQHLTNDEAMALGFALIQRAIEVKQEDKP